MPIQTPAHIFEKLRILIQLGRFKFLIYSPVIYTVGSVIAYSSNEIEFRPIAYLTGWLFVYCTHIMTHYFNEYYDFETDRLNTEASPWTGGSRVLPQGLLQPKTSLLCGRITMVFSLILAFLLPDNASITTALVIVFLSWAYSAPPLALESRGLGELIVVLVLHTLVPVLGCQLQTGGPVESALWPALIPMAIIGYIRMMVMNMPDIRPDELARKRTLLVRIGLRRGVYVHNFGMLLAYLTIPVMLFYFEFPVAPAIMIATSIPLAVRQCRRLSEPVWRRENPFISSLHNGLVMIVTLFGFLVSMARPLEGLSWIMLAPLAIYLTQTSLLPVRTD